MRHCINHSRNLCMYTCVKEMGAMWSDACDIELSSRFEVATKRRYKVVGPSFRTSVGAQWYVFPRIFFRQLLSMRPRFTNIPSRTRTLRFLDAPSHLYNRVFPSVRPSVRPSVTLSSKTREINSSFE